MDEAPNQVQDIRTSPSLAPNEVQVNRRSPSSLAHLASLGFISNIIQSYVVRYIERTKQDFIRTVKSIQEQFKAGSSVLELGATEMRFYKMIELIRNYKRKCKQFMETTPSVLSLLIDTFAQEDDADLGELIVQAMVGQKAFFLKKDLPVKVLLYRLLHIGESSYQEIHYIQNYDKLSIQSFTILLNCVNQLTVLRCHVTLDANILQALKRCQHLAHLQIYGGLQNLHDMSLINLFFTIKSAHQLVRIRRMQEPVESVIISFPYLRQLYIGEYSSKFFEFYRLLLIYYRDLSYVKRMDTFWEARMLQATWFNNILTSREEMFFMPGIKTLTISIRDMVTQTLKYYFAVPRAYNSFVFIVEPTEMDHDLYIAGGCLWLSFILSNFMVKNLTEFVIKIFIPFGLNELTNILEPPLRMVGKHLSRLVIKENSGFSDVAFLVNLINLCPTLRELVLVGRPLLGEGKRRSLDPLNKLYMLRFCCEKYPLPNTPSNSVFLEELLDRAPNVSTLYHIYEEETLERLWDGKRGQEISTLYMMLTKETKPTIEHFEHIFSRLPKLSEFVTDYDLFEGLRGDLALITKCTGVRIRRPFLSELEAITLH